mmetsp:Transcript_27184/g.54373  ORF Transcript_27184/g.54373 Transcript_27184/m.54373 type:complete len:116 (-) Transcript_27184:153-500(-)
MAAVAKVMVNKALGTAASVYCSFVGQKLGNFGLRYEDIMIKTPEVEEALELQDPHVNTGRIRRIKRGADLSFKRKQFSDYAPEGTDLKIFRAEIIPMVEKINARDQEFELLNKGW